VTHPGKPPAEAVPRGPAGSAGSGGELR
jgi:hypothetical protein